ncbi:MAG: flagellar biosynthesis anti-sigma factor FlgM [Deltaproteobacteria bacterium]|nr:flagellar biosynthesis anti-sigma factor FlgM [Deltaproteobacteria bacterium]
MKIEDLTRNMNQISSLETALNSKLEEKDDPLSGTARSNQSGEKVEFSNISIEYSKASKAMEKTPHDRVQKLEELHRRVKDGTYHVDAGRIADGILKDAFIQYP